ncbi:MAG: hypothetical protein ACKVP0_23520 [Pirellulaceae bacterium]
MSFVSDQVREMFVRGLGAATAGGIGTLLVTASLVWGAEVGGPPAEGFKVLPPNKTLSTDIKKKNEIEGLVLRIIRGDSVTGNETIFDGYFASYLFPQWTQTTEKNLNDLPKQRDRFVKNFLELSAKNSVAHARLVDLTHTKLSEIAQNPEFHPAVRYNAILIIGLLNETEPNRGTGVKQMPEPYIKALTTLMEELKKPGNNEAVRVGALLGVARHLEWDNSKQAAAAKIPPAMRTEAITELTSIVSTKIPPAGRSVEGQTWLRRRALEALGHANALKVEPEFAKILDDIITDDAEPISLRCTAADVMAHVDYQAPALPPIQASAKKLGYLALYACHSELLRLEGLKKYDERLLKISGGAAGGFGGGMPGGAPGGMPGGASPGGASPGGAMPGGASPGGAMPGGASPGGAMPGGAGGMPGMPGMPGASGKKGGKGMPGTGGSQASAFDPKAYRIDYSKRRLRAELYTVQLALGRKKDPTVKGLLAYSKAPADSTTLDGITKQVEEIIRIVEELDQSAEDYEKGLRKEMKKLENLTKPLPVAAVPGVVKGPAAPGEEVPMAAKPASEEPMEEIPAAPAAKGPAEPAKGGADPGKGVPPEAGKGGAAPADGGKAAEPPPAGKGPAAPAGK